MSLTDTHGYNIEHRTIKNNYLFMIDGPDGSIPYGNDSGLGLYCLDTRFLSCYEIQLNGTSPIPLLSSTESGYLSTTVYTNSHLYYKTADGSQGEMPEETIQLKRQSLLTDDLLEEFTLTSYHHAPMTVHLMFKVDADFRDIFEVRHINRHIRGEFNAPTVDEHGITYTYMDASGCLLVCKIIFEDFQPSSISEPIAGQPLTFVYETTLLPLQEHQFHLTFQTKSPLPGTQIQLGPKDNFSTTLTKLDTTKQQWFLGGTEFVSDNQDLNDILARSTKDIQMLMTHACWKDGGTEDFIAAGIPWYVALFGRDSLITARDCLILNPSIAKTTLKITAHHQGKVYNPERDEEPGKILHELRVGELARVNEIPHTPYYGSVDATPLWLILLYDYYLWTHDKETLTMLWPNALAAWSWIQSKLEKDPRGYLTYERQTEKGLYHQGWKDSYNSVMDADGNQSTPPIALVEVQGYVYLAQKGMKRLAKVMRDDALSDQLGKECDAFKKRFNQDFWLDELDYPALGLNSFGKPLNVISSNAGHCLESGIYTPSRAKKVIHRMTQPDMFNGWGIRTLSAKMLAYNPMSYHNGSVWPHDNAMIARGFAVAGQTPKACQVFTGLFEAARLMFYKRLPELFCGFSREYNRSDPPVRYPVACSPQAWAASSMLSLAQSMLNFSPSWERDALIIENPTLPPSINYLQLKNLQIRDACIDLEFRRSGDSVIVDVMRRTGKMDVVLEK